MFCYLIVVIPTVFSCNRERKLATANKQVTDSEFSKQSVYGTKIGPTPYKCNVKQNHFKCFDKVPNQRLLRKLERYGVSGNVLSWIWDEVAAE